MSKTVSDCLQGDFLHQLLHVGSNARRLLAMQDQDPPSPSFGCFHYAYWRDKTSEFPDARFQEAAAVLGLLSLDRFDDLRQAQGWPSKERLYGAFQAGLHNLAQQQYREGCYDEWYKGERGFAATAFTTCAFGMAALELGDQLENSDRELLVAVLSRAGRWLSKREDVVKINHEIVGAAALAILWKLTGEAQWQVAAKHKLDVSLAHCSTEGWFNELGGADLGYSNLCIDYLMIYFRMTGDDSAKVAAIRLLGFVAPHLHPDMTIAAEAGTCRNPYVGQVGFLLLQPHDPLALAIVCDLLRLGDSAARITSYLADDLRLARWASLPMLAAILAQQREAPSGDMTLAAMLPQGWTVHDEAALAACHAENLHTYVAVAGGSVVRLYRDVRPLFEDWGPSVWSGGETYTARIYDADRDILRERHAISASMQLEKVSYLFPSFLKRLLLRLGSLTPVSSRVLRALIDRYRLKNRSSVNQSASSVGGGGGRFQLVRRVETGEATLVIVDVLRDRQGALTSAMLRSDMKFDGNPVALDCPVFAQASEVTLTKIIEFGTGEAILKTEISYV